MRKVLTKMCKIDYLSFDSKYYTLEIFNLIIKLSTSFQQTAVPRIDKYSKCAPCMMFKQLKIYRIIIKTNESCSITNKCKM